MVEPCSPRIVRPLPGSRIRAGLGRHGVEGDETVRRCGADLPAQPRAPRGQFVGERSGPHMRSNTASSTAGAPAHSPRHRFRGAGEAPRESATAIVVCPAGKGDPELVPVTSGSGRNRHRSRRLQKLV